MGVVQHHDAVSGTQKQHVVFDYEKMMSDGYAAAKEGLFGKAGGKSSADGKTSAENSTHLFGGNPSEVELFAETLGLGGCMVKDCVYRNETRCDLTSDPMLKDFAVWNNLAQPRTALIDIPVASATAKIFCKKTGKMVIKQYTEKVEHAMSNYGPAENAQPYRVMFEAELPALGFSAYRVGEKSESYNSSSSSFFFEGAESQTKLKTLKYPEFLAADVATNSQATDDAHSDTHPDVDSGSIFSLESDLLKVDFRANKISNVYNKRTKKSIRVAQGYEYYIGAHNGTYSTKQNVIIKRNDSKSNLKS
jgi:hypothetical protein